MSSAQRRLGRLKKKRGGELDCPGRFSPYIDEGCPKHTRFAANPRVRKRRPNEQKSVVCEQFPPRGVALSRQFSLSCNVQMRRRKVSEYPIPAISIRPRRVTINNRVFLAFRKLPLKFLTVFVG